MKRCSAAPTADCSGSTSPADRPHASPWDPGGEVWIETNGRIFFSPDGISGWDLLPGLTQSGFLSVLAADPHHPGTVFAGGSALRSGNLVQGIFRHMGD